MSAKPPTRTNLHSNPQYVNATGASSDGTIIVTSYTASSVLAGGTAARFSRTNTSSSSMRLTAGLASPVLQASTLYTVGFDIVSTNTQTVDVVIRPNVASSTGQVVLGSVALAPNVPQRIVLSGTTTATAMTATAGVAVTSPTGTNAAAVVDITNVVVELGTTDGSFFSGATTDTATYTYSWTGTANASTSTAVATPGIWVEEMPDEGAPQAGVEITGLDPLAPSTVTVEVSWDDGDTWRGVRGMKGLTVTESSFGRDFVPPLNVEARYRLTVTSGAVTPLRLEDTITITSDTAWIQDPLAPRNAVPIETYVRTDAAVGLLAGSAGSYMRGRPMDLATPIGAREPVASIGTRQAPSDIPLLLRALASQGALVRDLRRLFDECGQLVLRGMPTHLGLDAVAHVVDDGIRDTPIVGTLIDQRTDWALTVTQTRPTSLKIVVAWWTYDDVQEIVTAALGAGATYSAVLTAAAGATYLEAQRDPELLGG